MNVALSRLLISVLVTIGFFVVIWAVLYYPIKPDIRDVVLLLIGALITSFKDVTNFFFSTSAGSAAKDQTIATLSGVSPPVSKAIVAE